MVRKLILVCILGFLFLAAFYTWRSERTTPPPRATTKAPSPEKPSMATTPSAQVLPESGKRPKVGAWGRNPFLTPEEEQAFKGTKAPSQMQITAPSPEKAVKPIEEEKPPTFTVSAIILQGARRVATINNQIVTVGDFLGEEKVLEIKADRVVLGSKGKKREIPIRQSPISIIVHPAEETGGKK